MKTFAHNTTRIILTIAVMVIFGVSSAFATSYYWVAYSGSSSGNWGDANHWSFTSGTAGGAGVPGSNDNAIFDGNSFTATGRIVTLNIANAYCSDMDWSSATNNPSFVMSASCNLHILGSLTFISGMTFTQNSSSYVYFEATTTGKTITTGNKTFTQNIYFNGTGGYWTLQDNLTTGQYVYLYHYNGTLNTNGMTVTCGYYNAQQSSPTNRGLVLGSSIFIVMNTFNIYNDNYTLDAGTSTLRFNYAGGGLTTSSYFGQVKKFTFYNVEFTATTGTASISTYNYGTRVFNNVTFASHANFYGSNKINNLNLGSGYTYNFEASKVDTITGAINATGACGNFTIIQSSVPGTQFNFFKSGGTIDVTYVSLKDNAALGSAVYTATYSIIVSNVSNWNITSPPGGNADYYWINGSGNWNDPSHWSLSSGGSANPYGCIPGSGNNVFFDAGSNFTSGSKTVTLNVSNAYCNSMNWTGSANTPSFIMNASCNLHVLGSLTFITAMSFTQNSSSYVYFEASTTGKTIATGGMTFTQNIYFNGTGGYWTLQDNFTTGQYVYLYHYNGTLNTNGMTVTCGYYNAQQSSPTNRGLVLGSSIFIVMNTFNIYNDNYTLDAGTSTLRFNYAGGGLTTSSYFGQVKKFTFYNVEFTATTGTASISTYNYGTRVFNNVTFASHANFYGSNKINNLNLGSGYTYNLEASKVDTITGAINATGACGNFTIIQSSVPGTQFNFFKSGGTIGVTYVSLKDNAALGSAVYTATYSIIVSNVSNWNITSPPGGNADYYWINGSGNWNDPSHWSLSSGGSANPYGCIPGSGNNVFFDAGSNFTSGSKTVTLNVSNAYCNSMNWTGSANTPSFIMNASCNLHVLGSLTFITAMSFTQNSSSYVYFEASTTGKTIATGGMTFTQNIYFNGTGGYWTLQDNFTTGQYVYLYHYNGTLNTNGMTVTCGYYNAQQSSPTNRGLVLGSSIFIVMNTFNIYNDNYTLDAGTSTLRFNYAGGGLTTSSYFGQVKKFTFYNVEFTATTGTASISTYNYGTRVFNNVTFSSHANFYGSNKINNLNLAKGMMYVYEASKVDTILGTLNATGQVGQLIDLHSSVSATQFTFYKSSGCVICNYIMLKDCNGTGGASWYAGANSTNVSNNSNWSFTTPSTSPASVSIAAVPAGTICAGTSVVFTATPTNGGTPTYQWKKNGADISGQTGVTYTTTTLANGDIITCVMTSSLCATNNPATSNAITETVSPIPFAAGTITGSPSVCLNVTGISYQVPAITWATDYIWTYSGTNAIINGTTNSITMDFASNATGGNLTVQGHNSCGTGTVSANYPIAITTYAITASVVLPGGGTISPLGVTNVPCNSNQAYTITPDPGYQILDVVVDGSSVGNPGTYTFYTVTGTHTITVSFMLSGNIITASAGPHGSISPAGNVGVALGANQTFTITPANCYAIADVVTETGSVGAVSSYTFYNVTAPHTITASFTALLLPAWAGSNSPVCSQTTLNLNSSGAGVGGSYAWTGPNSFSSNIQNPSITNVTPAATGNYTVTVTDVNGCTATTFTAVTVYPGASITAGGPTTFCIGGSVTLTATAGVSYQWSPGGATTQSIVANTLGTTNYNVTVSFSNGCTNTAGPTVVTINPLPTAGAGNNGPINEGNTLSLSSSGGVSYVWSGPNSFSSNVQNPSISNATSAASGTYYVTVTDANGCSAVASTVASVVTGIGFYWVGGTGNWSQSSHWATYSGGPGGSVVPGANDNVYFDANSGFVTGSKTVTVDVSTASCRDMDWTGSLNTPIFASSNGSNNLKIYGSLKLISGMNFTFNGSVWFESNVTGKTITSGGQHFQSYVYFDGAGGSWTLQDAFYNDNWCETALNYGTWNTNGQTVNLYRFTSSNENTRGLNLGASTIYISYSGSTAFYVDFVHLAFNAGTSNLTFTYNYNYQIGIYYYSAPAAVTFYDVTFAGSSMIGNIYNSTSYAANFHNVTFLGHGNITGNNTYNNVIFTAGKTYTLPSSQTQTINGTLTANGSCGNEVLIQSSSNGTVATLYKPSGTVTVDYVVLKDNAATPANTFFATNATTVSIVTGWTITPPSGIGVDYYWIGGTGNWSQPSHWSLSSGGAPNGPGCIPGSTNNVHFDANSGFTSGSHTVTVDVSTASCNDMTWTGALTTPVFTSSSGSNNLKIYGSLTLISGMNYTFSGSVWFEANSSKTITSAGQHFQSYVYFDGTGGTWTLQDAFYNDNWCETALNYGTLNTNGQTVNLYRFTSSNENTRGLNLGASTIYISYSGSTAFYVDFVNLAFNAGTSNLTFTYNYNYQIGIYYYSAPAAVTFYDVTFAGSSMIGNIYNSTSYPANFHNVTFLGHGNITGNCTYNNVIFTAGKTYTLPSSQTQTINGTLTANGSCGNEVVIQSSSNGTVATLYKPSGTVTVDYVVLKDNAATPANTWYATNATTVSIVTGWNITPPSSTGVSYYWIGGTGSWSQPSHWSLSSGGAPNGPGCIPGSTNNVYFDANSGFTSGSHTVTVDVSTASCNDMTWTGASTTPVFTSSSGSNNLKIYGSLTLISAMNYTFSGSVWFEANSSKTITSAGQHFQSYVYFDGAGGTWTLQDAFYNDNWCETALNYGTWNTNGQTVNLYRFTSSNENTRGLNLGSSTVSISYSGSTAFYVDFVNLAFNAGTSNLTFTYNYNYQIGIYYYSAPAAVNFYDVTFAGSSMIGNIYNSTSYPANFHNVTFSGHGNITGNCTYNNVIFTAGKSYTLPASQTQTINGTFTVLGSSGQLIDIHTSSGGTQATISKPSGQVCGDYLQLTSITGTGGAAYHAGIHSLGIGSNPGWTFDACVLCNAPTATLSGGTTPVCSGVTETFTVSASGGDGTYTYLWFLNGLSTGITTISYTTPVLTANASVYCQVTSCSPGQSTNTSTYNIVVNSLPTATAGSNTPRCAGTTLNLNSSGGTSYSWTGPNSFSSALQNPTISNVTTAAAGTYTVTVTNGAGCSATATTAVIINTNPVATAGSDSPKCVGTTLSLNSSGGTSYSWTGPNSFSSALQNPTISNVTTAAAGTYTVTVTNAAGCTATATTAVIINTNPVATAGSDSPKCVGTTLSLNSSGGTSYSWTGPNSFSSALQNPTISGVTTAAAGTYTVTVTNAAGCTATATTAVIINTNPVATAGSDSPKCVGTTLNLNSSGGTSYSWTGPNSFSSSIQNPSVSNVTTAAAGTYTVTVTNAAGCTATATTAVIINTNPVPTASALPNPVCTGEVLNLSGGGGGAGGNYAWSGPNSFTASIQNPSISPVTSAAAGIYTVTVTDANGCTATASTSSVVVNSFSSLTTVAVFTETMGNSGGTTTVAAWELANGFDNDPYTMSGTGNPADVRISTPSNGYAGASGLSNIYFSNGGTGNYNFQIAGINTSGLSNLSLSFGINKSTNASTGSEFKVEVSDNGGPFTALTMPVLPTGSGTSGTTWYYRTCTGSIPATNNLIIRWTNMQGGGTGPQFRIDDVLLTYTTMGGGASVTASGPTTFCQGGSVTLTASAGSSFHWSNGPTTQSIVANATGTYTVTITAANGCTASASQAVLVNPLPVPTAGNDSPMCPGSTLHLSSGGGVSYAWTGPNAFTSNLQNPVITNIPAAGAGNYIVTVTDANSCSASTSTLVTLLAAPGNRINAGGPTTFCQGGSVVLTADPGTSYLWSTGATTQSITASISGSYTVTISNALGCTSVPEAAVVQVKPLPVITVSPDVMICPGGSTQLTAHTYGNELFISEYVEGSSYNKAIEIYNPTNAAVDLLAGNYSLQQFYNGSATAGYIINLAGTIAPGGVYVITQSAAGTVLQALADTIIPTNGFYNGDDAVVLFKGSNMLDIIGRIGDDPGTQWVSGSWSTQDKTLRRKSSVTSGVTVSPSGTGPTAFSTLTTEWDWYPIDDFSGLGSHTMDAAYTWNPGTGLSSTTGKTVTANPAVTTVYTVNGADLYGCAGTAAVTVTVDNVPPTALCKNITVQLDSLGNASITAVQVDNFSSDNCGIASKTVSPDHFDCSNFGPNTVILTVTDVNGNTSTCTAIVTVEDHVAATAICKNITVPLDHDGEAYIVAADVDNFSWDACGIATYNVYPSSFTCDEFGPNHVTLTLTDIHGNVSSCIASVTVVDLIPADAVCQEITVELDSTGNASILAAQIDNGSWDACGIDTYSVLPNTFNCTNVGMLNPVTMTVTDIHGNESTCNTTVTVEDNIAPTITCKADQVRNTNDHLCTYTVQGNEFDPASFWDNCPGSVITNSHNSLATLNLSVFNKGTETVVWTVTDAHGLVSSCSFDVTIEDHELPQITCPGNMTENTDPGVCGDTIVYQVINGDNCPDYHILQTGGLPSGSVFPVGTTVNSFRVTDATGNTISCSFTVVIIDNEFPTMICPADQVKNTDPGTCSYTAMGNEFNPTNVGDNCNYILVNDYNNSNTLEGAIFDKGTTTVTWSITDASSNQVTCEFEVVVVDNELPTIGCVSDQDRNTTPGACYYYTPVGTEFDPTNYADNCPGAVITNDYNGGSTLGGATFNKGITHITWTVTDLSGNIATCSFDITVKDVEKPTISCQDLQVRNTDANLCTYTTVGNEFDPTTFADNCPGSVIVNDHNGLDNLAGSVFAIGITPVVWTVTDASGNASSCIFMVRIEDHQAPVIHCPADTILCYGDRGFQVITMHPAFTGDNCGVQGWVAPQPAEFPIGITPVTWTITDQSGNTSTCIQQITLSGPISVSISQNELPVFCQGELVELTANVVSASPYTPAVGYSWSTGDTTQVVQIGVNGNYTVDVVNAWGCHATASHTVSVNVSNLASSYVILARHEVKFEGVKVMSGGVGVKGDGHDLHGKIDAKKKTFITAAGTFAKATEIKVDNTSMITTKVLAPAGVPWPPFEAMVGHGTINVNVPNNSPAPVILSGSLYKEIKVGKNSTIIFTSPVVDIEKNLKLEDGATVKFTTCTKIHMKENLEAKKNITINPDDLSVKWFIDHDVNFDEGAHVTGVFYLGDANSHDTVKHHINIEESKISRPGIFKGMFLAEKIEAEENTFFYLDPLCNNCTAVTPKELAVEGSTPVIVTEPVVKNYPNPFSEKTTVMFILPQDNRVKLDVYDLSGKLVQTLYNGEVNKNQEYTVEFNGSALTNGIYIYKMTTNEDVVTGKMMLNKE